MKRNLQNLISLLLFTLMLFKVSSFHAYSHHDDTSDEIENCKICDVAIENQDTDYVYTTSLTIKTIPVNSITLNQPIGYKFTVSSSFLRFNFFGRPPPYLG